ncbi:hypothetical protein BGC07_12050 [Piscirickettsia litoralis]|uniref:Aminoglycoside/hydroxyurea antibiotic resistance kinase n=1 Tax=Piscirickettsia litoralis TaxID=1891921 RepID=A0ABX3A4T9_9GAMM|nr:hypothetical protein BGC07_12050 [Piscirickettsia litoralis]
MSKAKKLKNNLLGSIKEEIVLHGDLHHDNVIHHKDRWLAIDPKGVLGEREFEVAAFNFIHQSELSQENISELFLYRVDRLANRLNLDSQRIADWVFVRLVLAVCWMVEDNNDPTRFIKLIELYGY